MSFPGNVEWPKSPLTDAVMMITPRVGATSFCAPEPLPPTGQELGESQSQRSRSLKARFHPPHVTKTMQFFMKSPEGL
jgi:hypothetical protein